MHRFAIASILALGLAACASSPPPRYYAADGGPLRCANCGVVERIERVYDGESYASGGGAVLGAIIGGVLGNTLGKGDGRKAATIAGAVAGGVVGNEVEKNNNAGPYYEIFVALDDGRRVVVRQSELGPLRDGARVIVRGSRVERI
ncbi:MAG: glycine zipper 2TM domain-containing protein [Pseudomonadota bacterium]|jgi:outer membrane lipoprotein SlyB